MKQPILFQSRIIDLAEIESKLSNTSSKSLYNISNAFTLFQFIAKADYADYKVLEDVLKEYYDIELVKYKYKRLERPYAVDKLTGNFYPLAQVEYTHCGKLDGVVVYTSETKVSDIVFWVDSKSPELCFASSNRTIADIEILYDGWFE